MKAALVINPSSRSNLRRPDERAALRRAFARLGDVVESQSPSELDAHLRRWRAEGVGLIAVSGGDGTLHSVLNGVKKAWAGSLLPRFLILHGGTLGLVAQELGSLPPLAAVSTLYHTLQEGRLPGERAIPTLQVAGRLCFNFGVGVFANLPAEFSSRRGTGRWEVERLAAHAIGSTLLGGELARRVLTRWQGAVQVDGEPLGVSSLTGLYASGLRSMWRFRGFGKIPRPPGGFRVLTVYGGRFTLLRGLLPFVLGAPGALSPNTTLRGATRLVLYPAAPTHFMADGEFYPCEDTLFIEPGPTLRFLCPVPHPDRAQPPSAKSV